VSGYQFVRCRFSSKLSPAALVRFHSYISTCPTLCFGRGARVLATIGLGYSCSTLGCVGWTCLFCCHGDTDEPSSPDAVRNHDPNALSSAWGLESWCQLVWMLFCCWSWHVTFVFDFLFCDVECDGTNVIQGVDCVLGWVSLVVALDFGVFCAWF